MIKRNGDNVCAIASSNNQCQGARSAVSLCPGGAATRIPRATAVCAARMTPPDAHHNTKEANIALSTYVEKWKNRYEDAERKHKTYLLKSEKAKREYDDLQRRYNILSEERNHLDCELRERERELNKLKNVSEKLFKEYQQLKNQHEVDNILSEERNHLDCELRERERELNKLKNVSEKLFKEYQQLKNQHEVDAGVMHKVMQQAGEWYKQNKQLKRRSSALLQALPMKSVDIDFTDAADAASDTSSNEEVEFLKQTVSELSRQIASLQTDLNTAKLQEFEAHEANVALGQELETEKEKSAAQEKELEELRSQLERHHRVSKLLMDEVTALKNNADQDRQMAETYRSEARAAKKRVKLLTHQSSLLLADVEADARLLTLLAEVESLRDALEEQAHRHQDQLHDLQLKLAEKHEETDILLWEEKIRLAEEDARKAVERAEQAERRLAEAERRPHDADKRLADMEKKLAEAERRLSEAERSRPAQRRSNLLSRISYFESGGADRNPPRHDPREPIGEDPQEPEVSAPRAASPAPAVSPPRCPSPPPSPPPPPAPAPAPPPAFVVL
ncbi:hypothetical protein O3G_MSEX009963 [Manduca sexta]|uniref:Shootin-1 n=1 Tax=Manduca sexta TaxID=7130 RepID=A0A921ZH05_MANSE|nr:hypothetical protein O3G_MSEX009963 [Manduca sexta]